MCRYARSATVLSPAGADKNGPPSNIRMAAILWTVNGPFPGLLTGPFAGPITATGEGALTSFAVDTSAGVAFA